MEFTADTVFRRREGVITEAVLADVVVLDPQTGRYVRLNRTAALLWELLDGAPGTPATLAAALEQRLGAPAQRAPADVTAFIEAMLSRGLVEVAAPA
ncbi:unannotated protein [freshwater metagenome]|uniref:Unannotated protein n=1 Tax=freshwater metagenome TaxID=449393 RepID=A0A6J7EM48_9ZZZZ